MAAGFNSHTLKDIPDRNRIGSRMDNLLTLALNPNQITAYFPASAMPVLTFGGGKCACFPCIPVIDQFSKIR
jgi:hypothetical protein